ncbi:MAG: alanine--glyoxylate aminotransferase family protein [Ignavibacteriales bacterium]|nr:alanine--glyoxylate aminotransferase family protein [Ignavibacteriales bacterium]
MPKEPKQGRIYLFTPGPTPIPEKVMKRMAVPIIHHRSDEFRAVFKRVNANLQYLFQTSQPVLTLSSSGTGAMEATFVNLFSPGDKIISVNNGKFGERWVAMPRTFGLNVIELHYEWGDAPSPEDISNVLQQHPDAKAVYLVHCETSTGTYTDIRSISKIIHNESSALVCVDGVCSVGGMELRFDEWELDVCVTSSQKGLMVPPGLAFIALSDRAIESIKSSSIPKYYFDLNKALESYLKNDTPWTPAITLIQGLDASLEMIKEEGIESRWHHHSIRAEAVRAGVDSLGLKLFSRYPSDAVTTVILPPNIESKIFHDILRKKYSIYFAKGQGEYVDKIFRIAHIGFQDDKNVTIALKALSEVISRVGKGGKLS